MGRHYEGIKEGVGLEPGYENSDSDEETELVFKELRPNYGCKFKDMIREKMLGNTGEVVKRSLQMKQMRKSTGCGGQDRYRQKQEVTNTVRHVMQEKSKFYSSLGTQPFFNNTAFIQANLT